MGRLKHELAKQKMAVIKSKAEVIFSAKPGDTQHLSWIIENQSTEPWPNHAELREIDSTQLPQRVRRILMPGDSFELKYDFTLDLSWTESIKLFKLNLFDAETGEKFGDTMTGICTVIKPAKDEPARFSVTDQKFIAELKKQNSFNNKTAVKLEFFKEHEESEEEKAKEEETKEAQSKVDMIDQLLA
jgi:hypothetical protein